MALENGKENFSNTEASPCVLDVPRDMNSIEHGLVVCVREAVTRAGTGSNLGVDSFPQDMPGTNFRVLASRWHPWTSRTQGSWIRLSARTCFWRLEMSVGVVQDGTSSPVWTRRRGFWHDEAEGAGS